MGNVELRVYIDAIVAAWLLEQICSSPTCEARNLPSARDVITLHVSEMPEGVLDLFAANEWLDSRVSFVCERRGLVSSFRVLQNERGVWCISELTTRKPQTILH